VALRLYRSAPSRPADFWRYPCLSRLPERFRLRSRFQAPGRTLLETLRGATMKGMITGCVGVASLTSDIVGMRLRSMGWIARWIQSRCRYLR
jgi:hypothetical protein